MEKWQSVFGAVTDRELRLYESAPWSPEAWSAPIELCPLIATRFVQIEHFFLIQILRNYFQILFF